MKQLAILILYVSISYCSFAQESSVSLTGYLEKPVKDHVILKRFDGVDYHAVDSVLSPELSFTFNRPDHEINFYAIEIPGKRGWLQFVWDKSITIKLEPDSLWLSQIEGSPETDEYIKYKNSIEPLKKQVIDYSIKFNSASSQDSVKYYMDKQEQVTDSIFRYTLHYIKTSKPTYTSMYMIYWAQSWGKLNKEEVLPYYNLLTDEWKQHFLMKDLMTKLDRKEAIEKSFKEKMLAPTFSAVNAITQEEVTLEKLLLEKKPIVLDFWGIWCGPCIKSIPELKKAHNYLKDKVNFISVAWDSGNKRHQTVSFIKKEGMNWTHLFEDRTKNDLSHLNLVYEIESYPTLILIDAEGRLSKRAEGTEEVKELLEDLYDYKP